MLNGQWLNAGPLNSSGLGGSQVFLGAAATATATSTAPGMRVRRALSVAATATGTFPSTSLARRRGLAVGATATAEVFAGMSVEVDGIVQAYLAAYATASATADTLPLICRSPLSAALDASAVVSTTFGVRRALRAIGSASASVDSPFLYGFVNLGGFLPGQDSIVGSQRIRAFGFASATMTKRRRLSIAATATAVVTPLPRLQMQVRMAVAATATAIVTSALYRRSTLAVDASATATIDSTTLFTVLRLAANMTATAVVQPTLYMNIFDQAPIERTVFVRFQPRVAMPTRIRRVVDA